MLGETDDDGETLGLTDGLIETDGETDGLTDGLTDELGETDGEIDGLTEGDADGDKEFPIGRYISKNNLVSVIHLPKGSVRARRVV